MKERKSNYDTWCREWEQRFLAMDQEQLMHTLAELKPEGDYLTLLHFNRKYGICRSTGEICSFEEERPVSNTIKLNIYTLLGYASASARFVGEWVPFQSLKNTSPFASAYRKGVLEPFAATFTGHLDRLKTAFERLGGLRLPYSDMGYEISAFACIPVRFLFWEGDDEFPAQTNILFDRSATDFIHGESIVTISSVGIRRLAEEANLTPDPRLFSTE